MNKNFRYHDSIAYLTRSNSRRRRAPARTRRRRWAARSVRAGRGAPGPAAAEAPGVAWYSVRWTAGGRSGRDSRSVRRAAGSALGAGAKYSQTVNQMYFRIRFKLDSFSGNGAAPAQPLDTAARTAPVPSARWSAATAGSVAPSTGDGPSGASTANAVSPAGRASE